MKIFNLSFRFKTILLLCILSTFTTISFGQNWRTVNANDTNYFRVFSPIADSIIDGYLRSNYIVSSTTNLNFIQNILPYSTRQNALGILDTTMGNSWLGHQYIINTNTGEEFYFNVLNDTIKLKTQAQLNDSWIIAKDTNGIDYKATISSIDTLTIDGTIDSIKDITIQAFNGITPVANYFNNTILQLSKNHGFLTTTEFYTFPNYDSLYYNYNSPYPKLQYPHVRIEKNYTDINYRKVDLSWKYNPGNEWIVYKKDIGGFYIIHDSIINSTLINPNKIVVEYYRHSFYDYMIFTAPYHDTFYHTYTTIIDTVVADTLISKINNRLYEMPFPINISGGYDFYWNLLHYTCNGISIKDTGEMHTPLSGTTIMSNTYRSDYGLYANFYKFNDGVTSSYHELQTIYSKINSCIEGTKINFKTLATNDFILNNNMISLFPNPTSSELHFNTLGDLQIKKYIIRDISGKIIQENKYTSVINIQHLSNGYYVIQLSTDKGIVNKQFIKQ